MLKKCCKLLSYGVLVGFTTTQWPAFCANLSGLDASLRRISAASAIPGTFVAIVARDQVLYARGSGDYASSAPGAVADGYPSPYLRLGSITKTFNALLALRLAEAGRLSLATICPPQLELCPQSARGVHRTAVSVAQLLEHTSGMTDLRAKEFAITAPLALAAAALVAPASRVRHWPAGNFSVYSNNNAAAFSALVNFYTDTPYESLFKTQVFAPLGLTSATFARSQAVIASLPIGHARDGHTALPYWHVLYPAFGGLNLRARETIPLLQMFLNRGRHRGRVFLSEQGLSRMEHPATSLAARAGLTYGYGLGLYQWYRRGILFFGHDGDADGYLTHFGYAPALGRGYVVAINSDNRPGLSALRKEIETRLVGAGVASPPPYPLDEPTIDRVIGDYRAETVRFPERRHAADEIRVVRVANLLATIDGTGHRSALIPVSSNSFRRAEDGGPTIILVAQGRTLYLLGDDLGNYRKLP